jgi:hypothetical protein
VKHFARRLLACHFIKRKPEALLVGQAEAYRPRTEYYRDQRHVQKGVLRHDHVVTVRFMRCWDRYSVDEAIF